RPARALVRGDRARRGEDARGGAVQARQAGGPLRRGAARGPRDRVTPGGAPDRARARGLRDLKERIVVRVGSRNAAKLEAVRRGLAPFFARVDVLGGDAGTGVHAQPPGFAEIIAG